MSPAADRTRASRVRRVALVLVMVGALLVAGVAPAVAFVRGSPDFSATLAGDTVEPGETTALELTLLNSGEVDVGPSSQLLAGKEQVVTTAQGTVVRVDGGGPIDVETGAVGLGAVPQGSRTVPVQVTVPEDADPGTYELDVTVEYDYVHSIPGGQYNVYQNREKTERMTVAVTVEERPRFAVVEATTDTPVGGSGAVDVTVENVGSATANDSSLTLQSTNAALTFGGTASAESYAGQWAPGERRTLTFDASVAPGTTARPLALQATLNYEDGDGVPRTTTLSTGVTPADANRFRVSDTNTTAAVGDSGELSVALTNTGNRTLTDAAVTLESSNAALTFGGSPSAKSFVGDWAPGETRSLAVESSFGPAAETRTYAVEATVSYEGANGETERAQPVTLGVRPAREQAFDLDDHATTLRVGEEGRLTGTLANDGPSAVENAVLILEPPANVRTSETQYAVGEVAAGESVEFRYDVEVSAEAREGPRQFTYRLQYDDADGDTVTSDPLYARGAVAPQRDVFEVTSNASLSAGSSSVVEVEVTNNGDEPVSNVQAQLFADDPISADNDEAFTAELAPGETETLTFQLSAAGGALAKTYPVSIDFQYDEPDGDTKISDSYQVAVEVTERSGGGILSTFPAGGFGLAGVGLGVVLSLGGIAAVGLGLVRRP
jgi:hypothetical protein